MCNLTDHFNESQFDQEEQFYQELENDPEFVAYMEQKLQEWCNDMEQQLNTLKTEENVAE
jgi:hypothetical protein